MKKFLTLALCLTLTCSASLAASFGDNLKNAVKADIQNVQKQNQQALKEKQQANKNIAQAKKEQKIKEIDVKIKRLNENKKAILADKNITETQRTLKLNAIQKQIDLYTKQKAALK